MLSYNLRRIQAIMGYPKYSVLYAQEVPHPFAYDDVELFNWKFNILQFPLHKRYNCIVKRTVKGWRGSVDVTSNK